MYICVASLAVRSSATQELYLSLLSLSLLQLLCFCSLAVCLSTPSGKVPQVPNKGTVKGLQRRSLCQVSQSDPSNPGDPSVSVLLRQ